MTPSRLVGRDLHLAYGSRSVLEGIDLEILHGALTVIIGPNACGKSTLLRAFSRLLTPVNGAVLLDGEDIANRSTNDIAARIGLLPQSSSAPDGMTVLDLVGRGRHPHRRWFASWSSEDRAAVETAMIRTGTFDLTDRLVDELSGGQRQRVWMAMALAQETGILLLDEPITHLDLVHQVEVLDLVADLVRHSGRTAVAALHDVNLASRYADEIIVMNAGRIIARGSPAEVITESVLEAAFAMKMCVIDDPVSSTPLVVPRNRPSRARAVAPPESAPGPDEWT